MRSVTSHLIWDKTSSKNNQAVCAKKTNRVLLKASGQSFCLFSLAHVAATKRQYRLQCGGARNPSEAIYKNTFSREKNKTDRNVIRRSSEGNKHCITIRLETSPRENARGRQRVVFFSPPKEVYGEEVQPLHKLEPIWTWSGWTIDIQTSDKLPNDARNRPYRTNQLHNMAWKSRHGRRVCRPKCTILRSAGLFRALPNIYKRKFTSNQAHAIANCVIADFDD